jgi:hypothetical protein
VQEFAAETERDEFLASQLAITTPSRAINLDFSAGLVPHQSSVPKPDLRLLTAGPRRVKLGSRTLTFAERCKDIILLSAVTALIKAYARQLHINSAIMNRTGVV